MLTVGPVRGFAFFLGLSTILDVVVAWFFTRPMVGLLASNRLLHQLPAARGGPRPRRRRPRSPPPDRSGPMTAPVEQPRRVARSGRASYHGETNIRFVAHVQAVAVVISGVIIGIGLLSLWQRGLNLGIDFEGGVVWEVPAGDVSVADAQDAMDGRRARRGSPCRRLTAEGEVRLRVEAEPLDDAAAAQESATELAELTGSDVDDVSLNAVGPSWGEEISRKALRALVFFLIAITIYITFRFEFRMAIPTLVALIHDVLITIGVYSIAGFEVTPATVIALLTILGFSIYDGIVVFDKVDENTQAGRRQQLDDLQRHGRPLAEPGAHAVAEHLDHRPAPGGLAARPRLVHPRRHHAAGVRPRPAHRPVRRRLLVDLHRLAAAGRAQGARAQYREVRRSWPSGRRAPSRPGRLGRGAAVDAPSRAVRSAIPPARKKGKKRSPRLAWSMSTTRLAAGHLRDVRLPEAGIMFKDITPCSRRRRVPLHRRRHRRRLGGADVAVAGIEAGVPAGRPVAYRLGRRCSDPQARQAAVGGRGAALRARVRRRRVQAHRDAAAGDRVLSSTTCSPPAAPPAACAPGGLAPRRRRPRAPGVGVPPGGRDWGRDVRSLLVEA